MFVLYHIGIKVLSEKLSDVDHGYMAITLIQIVCSLRDMNSLFSRFILWKIYHVLNPYAAEG